eukprot:Clim_evm4s157 gene=Clim_evmTU4s157
MVSATLTYLSPDTKRGEKLVFVPSTAGNSNSKWPGENVDKVVDVVNARECDPQPHPEKEGFGLISFPDTKDLDLYNDNVVNDQYYPMVIEALKQTLGAEEAYVFDHTRRASRNDLIQQKVTREPSSIIHGDYTTWSAQKRLRSVLGEEKAEALLKKYSRFAIYNLWRSSNNHTIENYPMTFCDRNKVDDSDLVTIERHDPQRIGQVQAIVPSSTHRWYYYPLQRTKEALIFCTYDSVGENRGVVHTSFNDPTAPADAAPRESIEVRTLLFW